MTVSDSLLDALFFVAIITVSILVATTVPFLLAKHALKVTSRGWIVAFISAGLLVNVVLYVFTFSLVGTLGAAGGDALSRRLSISPEFARMCGVIVGMAGACAVISIVVALFLVNPLRLVIRRVGKS